MSDTPPISNLPDLSVELGKTYAAMVAEKEALAAALKAIPATFTDDAQLEAARKAVTDTNGLLAKAKRTHESEKAPYLKGSRDVDQFFNAGMRDVLAPLKTQVADRVAHHLEKVRQERQAAADKAAAEAAAAQEKLLAEAEALEAAGRTTEADAKMNAAVIAETDVQRAESFTTKSTADQSRVHTGGGSMSVRTVKAIRSIDRTKLDLESLRPFFAQDHLEAAIKRFIGTGQSSLKGVDIYDKPVSTIR